MIHSQNFKIAMHQEKYSLTWHTYSDHLRSMMKELMMNEDFADVTLVTEDKKQIKANISILSACSPVFKEGTTSTKNICVSLNLFLILSDKCHIREVFIHHQFFHHGLQMI